MDRRAFIGTLAGGLLTAPLAGEAQAPAKVPTIGFLAGSQTRTPRHSSKPYAMLDMSTARAYASSGAFTQRRSTSSPHSSTNSSR